jgi:hypothetical protein
MKVTKHLVVQTLSLLILIFLNQSSYAQSQGRIYIPTQTTQVKHDGQTINSAWCGGLNSIQPVEVDLNNDGKKDLVQYDHSNYLVKTFINIGNTNETKYVYNPKYEKNFPLIKSYLILKDYNCDGIADLFHRSDTGVIVYKGYYSNAELKFAYYKAVQYPAVPLPIWTYVQIGDIPVIEDIDHDGDLDMLTFDVQGIYVRYFKNMRVENNLPCDSIAFTSFDKCWGKFYQSWNKTAITNITCKGGEGNDEGSNKQTRHSGNCLLAMDMEGDGDWDLLDGVFINSDIQLLFNGASTNGGNNLITSQDTTYNQNSQIVNIPTWPVPSSLDIDHDGDQDLLFSSHTDNSSSANYQVAQFYKNVGTNANPNFVFIDDTLFTPDMIDVGIFSYPTFFDYDKDGNKDLFVGTEGYLNNTTGLLETKLAFYKNTSTATTLSFNLITKDFLSLSLKNYKGLFPAFGDVTGDSIDDLILGGVDGKIAVYKNQAATNNAQANFIFHSDSLANVKVDQYSFPIVYDADHDGKGDLLIGNANGNIEFFKDTSLVANTKSFKNSNPNYGNIRAGKTNQLNTFCAPFIGKIDSTQKEYLLVGNSNGTIQRFDSLTQTIVPQIDSMYSFIQTTSRSVPAVADLNNDGIYEMVIGNKLGGLVFYQQVLTSPAFVNDFELSENNVVIYPNPSSSALHINFNDTKANATVQAILYDITGQQIAKQSFNTTIENKMNIDHLPNGIYILKLSGKSSSIVKKVIKN